MPSLGIEPRPHWLEARPLATAPFLLMWCCGVVYCPEPEPWTLYFTGNNRAVIKAVYLTPITQTRNDISLKLIDDNVSNFSPVHSRSVLSYIASGLIQYWTEGNENTLTRSSVKFLQLRDWQTMIKGALRLFPHGLVNSDPRLYQVISVRVIAVADPSPSCRHCPMTLHFSRMIASTKHVALRERI